MRLLRTVPGSPWKYGWKYSRLHDRLEPYDEISESAAELLAKTDQKYH